MKLSGRQIFLLAVIIAAAVLMIFLLREQASVLTGIE